MEGWGGRPAQGVRATGVCTVRLRSSLFLPSPSWEGAACPVLRPRIQREPGAEGAWRGRTEKGVCVCD